MKLWRGLFAAGLFLVSVAARPDTLELKNGSVIKGTYAGGSETQISFRVGSSVQQYAIVDIASLKFDSRDSGTAKDGAGFAQRQPQAAPVSSKSDDTNLAASSREKTVTTSAQSVTVPSGSRLFVRMIDSVDSDKNQVGDRFMASLEEPLYAGDTLLAAKGTSVYGRLEQVNESGQLVGKAQMRLTLTSIVINGRMVPLSTGDYNISGGSRGASTAKKVGGGAAIGALIGAIAGGGKGAAIGAGVGAGAGTAVQVVTKGDQVHVPSETLLEFTLDQPLNLPVAAAAH
ncbi:MAG TPA: hypothetical protein VJ848_01805 [Candidatus Angelobacter sp.]|nr:hypothetical protein [Candidatus Angelobacter sp.]